MLERGIKKRKYWSQDKFGDFMWHWEALWKADVGQTGGNWGGAEVKEPLESGEVRNGTQWIIHLRLHCSQSKLFPRVFPKAPWKVALSQHTGLTLKLSKKRNLGVNKPRAHTEQITELTLSRSMGQSFQLWFLHLHVFAWDQMKATLSLPRAPWAILFSLVTWRLYIITSASTGTGKQLLGCLHGFRSL